MRNDGRNVHAGNAGEVVEDLRAVSGPHAGADRHRPQLLDGIHRVFRRADVDEIFNADARIEPVGRLHLTAAAQAQQNGIRHALLGQAEVGGFGTVNGNLELCPIVRLLHAHVHRTGYFFDFTGQFFGDGVVRNLIASDNLHVKGRGQAEIQRLAHDVRRQEINHRAGKFAIQAFAQFADVTFRRRVAGF